MPCAANYYPEHHLGAGALHLPHASNSRCLPECGGDFTQQDKNQSTSTLS